MKNKCCHYQIITKTACGLSSLDQRNTTIKKKKVTCKNCLRRIQAIEKEFGLKR